MGLQVRVYHSLGDKIVDLAVRDVENPLIIGRASGSDVQIPSTNVSRRHCVLFVHEGRWVVQDAGSSTGTFLNGERLGAPAFLSAGDVISLGAEPNPPMLVIDPEAAAAAEGANAGPQEQEADEWAAAAPTASQWLSEHPEDAQAELGGYESDAQPQPELYDDAPAEEAFARSAAPPPVLAGTSDVSPEYSMAGADQTDPAPDDAWMGAGSARRSKRYYVPKQQGASAQMIAIGAVIAVIIVVITIVVVSNSNDEPAPPPVAAVPNPNPIPMEENKNLRKSKIFSDDAAVVRPKVKPAVHTDTPAANPDAIPATQADNTTDAGDAAKPEEDPEWEKILDARQVSKPGVALALFDNYRLTYEGKHKKDLDDMTEEVLDRLWWERIVELCKMRDESNFKVREAIRNFNESQDSQYKAGYTRDRQQAEKKTEIAVDDLKMMGYPADVKLEQDDLYNSEKKAELRGQRDDKKYHDWSRRVLGSIRRTHGALPWDGSR
ncbi:MAG TPA: FHA domain-containing protein [Tepidisphaeraceae bacterium]|jgi:hypothetical protein